MMRQLSVFGRQGSLNIGLVSITTAGLCCVCPSTLFLQSALMRHLTRRWPLRISSGLQRAGHGADDSAKVREVHRLMKEEEEAIGRGRVADIKKEFEKHYRDLGCDVGRITEHCDCVPVVLLKKWNGRYISVLGKVKGLPTLDDAYEAGIFAADCCSHRVYPVFPEFDELPKWLVEKIGPIGA